MRMDVRQHTENLVDWLSALHFGPQARCQSGFWFIHLPVRRALRQNSKRYEERLRNNVSEQQEYYKQRQILNKVIGNIPLVDKRNVLLARCF